MKKEKLESGKVKFFDSRDANRYGFIRLDSGKEIFFHENDYQKLNADDGNKFNFYGIDDTPRQIKKGDKIYFERSEGSKGRDKACPWCFEEDQVQALADLAARARYRVRQLTTIAGQQDPIEDLVWEGTNLSALTLVHPRHADPTLDTLQSFESGDRKIEILFEIQRPDDEWIVCEDPRTRPGHHLEDLWARQVREREVTEEARL